MQVERLAQYDDDKGMTFQDAIAAAQKQSVRILSNKEIDARLQGDDWKQEKEMYPCWTGTFIAYPAKGQPFGKTVEYKGMTFNVPRKFQGKKDRAIICNHPDFILKGNIITPGKSARCIPFPQKDGWYVPDVASEVPSGGGSSVGTARYLWRWSTPYCGLLARRYYGLGGRNRRGVVAGCGPGSRLGVFGVKGTFKMPEHKHVFKCECGATR